ncbi:MAG: HAMP domain-containing protein [Lachnospiraceae bacterium]|nr:HAMP domain-containing protein [Lachnospiraceae bacterium]
MSEKQKNVKVNKRLMNAKLSEKFKKAFTTVIVGVVIAGLFSIANILYMSASLLEIGFPMHRLVLSIVLVVLAVVFTISLCANVAKALPTSIIVPINELQAAVRKLKAGEFDVEITYDEQDEIGELAEDLRQTCAQMQTVVSDAGYLLGEMAEGRFNVSTEVEDSYVGDFKVLVTGMEKLSVQMDDTLRQIREASERVMLGSEQLADSAQELAEGATNQAGAVEELTATIENVTNISEESAENAVKAATSAKEAAEDAKKSREGIGQLTSAMERITETSREIENIIAAIEDIASQTNLLSLNASIEAARAGEAGRGFAVVADQIGKLAADSAQSAVTTRELISKSLVEVEDGNRIVEQTIESIDTVLANMDAFAGMASGAAEASKVQADMLKQVEAGIDQISIVVQNNSAAAQETSAVSEELSTQSVGLEEMVSHFVLREEE